MIQAIFESDSDGTARAKGHATIGFSSSLDAETVIETTEDDLTAIFKQAESNGETLEGADGPIGEAIDDPLSFIDYLVLDGDTISFDSEYVRDLDTGT